MGFGFRAQQPGLKKLLGDLEADIMEIVWSHPAGHRVSVRDIYETLRLSRTIAYTTVMTVMGNLAKKDVLMVEKSGTAYLYFAPMTREEFTSQEVGKIVNELLTDFSDAAVAHFTKALQHPEKEDVLSRLKQRIDEAQRPDQG